MSLILVAIMVTGLLATAGVASIVLFIVGLVKRRPAMWGTGLGLGVVVLLMVVAVGGAAMWMAPMGATIAPTSGSVAPPTVLTTTSPSRRTVSLFEECTGLAPPSGAGVQRSMSSTSAGSAGTTKECLLVLTAPGEFGAFLDANLKKATWQEVSSALAGPRVLGRRAWMAQEVQGLAYYTQTYSGGAGVEATDTWTTAVAYDAKTGKAYVAGVRKKAGK